MKKIKFHKAIHLLLLVVMMLTSTGFSTVVGYCSMSNSSVCCCDMEQTRKQATSSKSLTIKSITYTCYSEKVAGGVNDVKAIYNFEIVQKQLSFAVAEEATEYQIANLATHESHFPKSPHIALYPTGVDIYIQVSSFLI
ncbi:MAG: hypothetical protein ACYC09_13635 [Bacteroidota bacterium]